MKFDSFVKYVGSHGTILEASDGSKWLFGASVGMKIPEYSHVCGTVSTMPDYIDNLIYEAGYDACGLTDAYVPNADSKPSELLRVFKSAHESIDISNKAFGFIEKKDLTYISTYSDCDSDYTALLVTDDYSDEPEFKMIIINK